MDTSDSAAVRPPETPPFRRAHPVVFRFVVWGFFSLALLQLLIVALYRGWIVLHK